MKAIFQLFSLSLFLFFLAGSAWSGPEKFPDGWKEQATRYSQLLEQMVATPEFKAMVDVEVEYLLMMKQPPPRKGWPNIQTKLKAKSLAWNEKYKTDFAETFRELWKAFLSLYPAAGEPLSTALDQTSFPHLNHSLVLVFDGLTNPLQPRFPSLYAITHDKDLHLLTAWRLLVRSDGIKEWVTVYSPYTEYAIGFLTASQVHIPGGLVETNRKYQNVKPFRCPTVMGGKEHLRLQ